MSIKQQYFSYFFFVNFMHERFLNQNKNAEKLSRTYLQFHYLSVSAFVTSLFGITLEYAKTYKENGYGKI